MSQDAKLIARISECLPKMSSEQKQGWIENPRRLQQVLKVLAEVPSDPKVWKRITLGNGPKNADGFREAIQAKGMKTGDWASDIMNKPAFTVTKDKTEINLVVVSVADLGFPKGATREQIYQAAIKRGYELCSPDVGSELRLQYEDQSKDEWLVIGMEPIAASDGDLRLFYVERNGSGQWLGSCYGFPDVIWGAVSRFVFVLPGK